MRSRSRPVAPTTVGRRFGTPLHPAEAQVSKSHGFRANQVFQPLPSPTGVAPFHLGLETVLGVDATTKITEAGQLVFHCAGDTGGVKAPQPQQIVAYWMEQDLVSGAAVLPSFFYHLGDVVYYNGQKAEYYPQFYEPYAQYGVPILAIPGNHDGDPLDATVESSLAGFVENFCATTPHLTPEAQEVQRDSMTEPNVYWTLEAPFVTVVGLYTNVPEGGRLDQDQINWLQAELAGAPTDVALIIAMHHPPYSADAHHGGSAYMGGVLDAAIQASGRTPDAVLTGHVHNYQRFTRKMNGRQLPYVVAGAGGYWNLHYLAKDANGNPLPKPWQTPDANVTLENYCEDRHGYLRLTASATALKGEYITVPRPQESWRNGPVATLDTFTLDLKTHTVS
jgi:acid phosphatase type 7